MHLITNRTAILKIGNEVVGVVNADTETLHDIDNLKCIIACEYNIEPDLIEVIYKEEKYELGDTFVSHTGRWCQNDHLWTPQPIDGIGFFNHVNEKTSEGINTILDYIKMGIFDELVKFN